MERNTNTRAYENDQQTVLSIQAGGTNATNILDAITNLGAINKNRLGVSNGIASLDSNVKILPEQLPYVPGNEMPSLFGPASVYTHSVTSYEITNFDSQVSYLIEANHGMINYAPGNSSFQYEAPATPGTDVISINGRQYPLQVLLSYIEKPTFTWPANNAVISILHPVLEASLFACVGYQDDQASSTFEVASDPNFTNVLYTIFNDSGHGESGPFHLAYASLATAGDYYVRVKYTGYLLGDSEWSDTLHIERQIPVSYPTTEVDILHRPNIATVLTGGLFGINAALSPDGTLLAISDPNVNVEPQLSYPNERYGEIYIYKKINNVWVYQTAINSGKSDSGFIDFGSSIRITPDNQFIIVGSGGGRYSTNKGEQSGIVQIFKTLVPDDYSTLFVTNYIDATPSDYANTNLGQTISLSADGQILAITAAGAPRHSPRVLIHTFDGVSNYVPSAVITNPLSAPNSVFGAFEDMALAPSGDRLLVADRIADSINGRIYVYDYDGANWNLTNTIPIDASISLTSALVFSNQKDKFAFGIVVNDSTAQASALVYEYSNNIWTMTYNMVHSDWNSNTLGGSVRALVFAPDGQSLIIGSSLQTALYSDKPIYGVEHRDGAVYRFKLTGQGNAWSQEFKYTASDLNPAIGGAYFGNFILLNNADNEMIIGSKYKDWSQNSNEVGAVYIFR